MIQAFAPAKVNLALHVVGRRADGYHLLDGLVVFVGVGDRIRATPAAELSLSVAGEGAEAIPTDGRNLVMQAARLMGTNKGAALHLDKALPSSAGIGGGSSDAAATMRALARLWGCPLPAETLTLGADLPVCMRARPTRMRGIGERLDPVPDLPPLHMLLVNPRQPVATPDVFKRLETRDNPGMEDVPQTQDPVAFTQWLSRQRNDLERPARAVLPMIGKGLEGLHATRGCLLARMSGSGATCFGLYASADQAEAARAQFSAANPAWWAAAGPVLKDDQRTRATT